MIIFETERLIVQPFTEDDKEYFFQVNGDPDVMRYIRPAKSRLEADAFLVEVISYSNEMLIYGRWAVRDKILNQFIGSFALIPVEHSTKMQLGYALLPHHWGKGYATELTRAGICYTFTKTSLNEVYGYTEKGNLSSQKVLLKCGFVLCGQKEESGKIVLEHVFVKNNMKDTST